MMRRHIDTSACGTSAALGIPRHPSAPGWLLHATPTMRSRDVCDSRGRPSARSPPPRFGVRGSARLQRRVLLRPLSVTASGDAPPRFSCGSASSLCFCRSLPHLGVVSTCLLTDGQRDWSTCRRIRARRWAVPLPGLCDQPRRRFDITLLFRCALWFEPTGPMPIAHGLCPSCAVHRRVA